METTTLSTKYQLVLPKATRESLHLKPGQRFLVRASERGIELVPCEPLAELRGFLSGADTGMDDIRERDERV
ncbi:MAG: AbrB/MazE/SpoVT family DNA-binding domain-containing protein [Chromatiaceae bacterium]|nr:AbrB/MazE/SpoVT family DNA-binding domain-containing protein [Chromatiaceae bacterium]MBP6733945.1 AbrB/MazE/SpoVT family DNA-binding domain-containing protein [Chromatiaceae bacterium]MBP6806980.1 AbrB/MazE/SpoVT family DNA-binding domain-containing protein [Chromatiaceae bacterium]MBP8282379.1 AbrB/MazE/SpoVT family DNA-binding domain-containing protein [Chromatiaceae bacterium]MBP8288563.1 AbrB/MazE/SpoVT family DNA-binding domain-containing protein [Chromatiaceae bacterium]